MLVDRNNIIGAFRCDNQTPTGVLIPLPDRSSCRV